MTLIEAEKCGVPGCAGSATGYAVRVRGAVALETFLGQRTRPHEVPTCSTHMAVAIMKPAEFRRLLA